MLDIKFPRDTSSDVDIPAILNEIARSISIAASNSDPPSNSWLKPDLSDRIPGQRELAKPALRAPEVQDGIVEGELGLDVVIDIDLRFRDVKAAVPIFTSGLSYTNNALVRPIVAFIKSVDTLWSVCA